ncbi:caspase family protein [Bradyrhizobium sp. OK095]|uniref:caspase family protein n=1 Tax=Bradyrhizobium sp. OK095 TaxID=1882760 RepID=UPI0008BF04B2|nr:caspase family protein [Bradyrhizobium sp. OK095]SEO02678.1 WD40 repeat [Bradyrhizobium sp. OK095]
MKLFCLFVLSALALAFQPSAAFADQRMALVMGNSAYQRAPKLANATNDANLLVETFKKAGFTVVDARNDLSAQDMRRTLRDFGAKARSADIAVVYYAGHGIEIDGNNYIVPVDAQLENDTDVYDETIGLDRILVAIEPAKKLRLVILDACRDNPFSKNMKRTMASRAVARGLAKVEPSSPNTLVAFAAKAGLTALDGDGKNSPFATALAHHLATPGLDLRKAFGYVRDEVLQATTNRQEPFIYGSLGGDDVVLAPAAAPPPPPPVPVASTDTSASRDYEFSERVGTVEAWDLYIAAHPSGFYTDLAKVQRNKLAAARPAPTPATVAIETKKVETTPVLPPQPESTKPVAAPKLAAAPAAITPLTLASPPATETKSVAAVPVSSCTTRIARRGSDAVGGPFIPVSIKPNVEGASVRTIAVSPNGREIATAGDDGVIRLWDASSFRQTRVLRGHSGAVYALDYWADSTLLASAGWDGKVKVWDLRSDGQSLTFDAGAKQFAVAFAPEPSLKYLASAGEDGVVRIWNLGTRELARSRLDHQSPDPARAAVRSLSYAPSGSGEFVSAGYDGKIRFYRTSGAVDAKDAYGRKALRVAYSPDGTRVVTAGSDAELGSAKVFDVRSGASRLLVGHRDYVVSASWSADSKRIVTGGGGRDKSVNLWDAESGRLLASFAGHQEDIEAVAFFPGGTRLISASEDKTIKVWDVAERRLLLTAIGFGDDGFVSYTPEGCYAGSNGVESRLSIFNGSRYEPMSMEARKAMQEPAGFMSLLAR